MARASYSTEVTFSTNLIEIRADCRFPAPTGVLFDDFRLELKRGSIVCIVGASGCGKTTLLHLISGVLGTPVFLGQQASQRPQVAYAFQSPKLLPWHSSWENVRLEGVLRRVETKSFERDIELLVESLGLKKAMELPVETLSSGTAQRLQIARCASVMPDLLLLDEPLGAVDQPTRVKIAWELAKYLRERGVTTLWVTHDTMEAVAVGDRVLVLGGRPVRIGLDSPVTSADNSLTAFPMTGGGAPPSLVSKLLSAIAAPMAAEAVEQNPIDPMERSPRLYSLLPIVPLVIGLMVWEVVAGIWPTTRFFLSRPSEWIPAAILGLANGPLLTHAIATLRRAALGMGIAATIGIPLGILTALRPSMSQALRPWLAGMSVIPLFVVGPAFIMWFGVGDAMKIAISSATAMPIVALMVLDTITSLRDAHLKYLFHTGASFARVVRYILAPGTLWIGGKGLRFSLLAALLGAFIGEIVASESGLGYYILLNASRFRMDLVFAGLAVFLAAAFILELVAWRTARTVGRLIGAMPAMTASKKEAR